MPVNNPKNIPINNIISVFLGSGLIGIMAGSIILKIKPSEAEATEID
jgi:hypothetical protein